MLSKGLVVRVQAKAGKEQELADYLAGAQQQVEQEQGTPVWLALRADDGSFWVVDAFPGDDERQAHLTGPVAAGLMSGADEFLDGTPEVRHADVLGAKPSS